MFGSEIELPRGRPRATASGDRRVLRLTLITVLMLLTVAPGAGAASIAYVDNGEVWLSSLDGGQKALLAPPVVNTEGLTENWLAVAASDSGRIVAVRNVPGRDSRFSWFRGWEANGSSTVEGRLGAPGGYATYTYPLGLDVTGDGSHVVYGFTNSSACCPITLAKGTYVRPATSSVLDPMVLSGHENPTLLGDRVIARSGTSAGVQGASGAPYGAGFTPWFDAAATGLDLRRTDVAANGQLAALELEQWTSGQHTIGKIAVIGTQGVDQAPTYAVDCFLPASGVAREPSLSGDATRIAWTDGQGLKVAGTPATAADPCSLTSPPVVISPTASQGSIGGAHVGAFLPAPPGGQPPGAEAPAGAPPPAGGPSPTTDAVPGGGPPPTIDAVPVASVPRRMTMKALARRRGLSVTVRVARAGNVRISGTVRARVLGRRGRPVVVVTGAATARRAGTVRVTVRLTRAARRQRRRLNGTRMTLRVSQGGLSSTLIRRLR